MPHIDEGRHDQEHDAWPLRSAQVGQILHTAMLTSEGADCHVHSDWTSSDLGNILAQYILHC